MGAIQSSTDIPSSKMTLACQIEKKLTYTAKTNQHKATFVSGGSGVELTPKCIELLTEFILLEAIGLEASISLTFDLCNGWCELST